MASKGRQDHYSVLGVAPDAPDEVIRAAYRALAAKYHPDKNPGDPKAELRLKKINAAFQVLGDATKRAQYDELTQSPSDESDPPSGPVAAPTPTPPAAKQATTERKVTCWNCGAKVNAEATRCVNCWKELKPDYGGPNERSPAAAEGPSDVGPGRSMKTCWRCGAVVKQDATRCSRCLEKQVSDQGAPRRSDGEGKTAGVMRALYAFAAMGLSLWINTSDTPLSAQPAVSLLLGIALLGIIVYRVTTRPLGVGLVFALGLLVVALHAAMSPGERERDRTQRDLSSESAIATVAAPTPTTPPAPRQLRLLTPIEWQRCLILSGYDIGPTGADGVWGPQSEAAFQSFKRRHPDGVTAEEIHRCWRE